MGNCRFFILPSSRRRLREKKFGTQIEKVSTKVNLFGTQIEKVSTKANLFGTQIEKVSTKANLFGTQIEKVSTKVNLFGTKIEEVCSKEIIQRVPLSQSVCNSNQLDTAQKISEHS